MLKSISSREYTHIIFELKKFLKFTSNIYLDFDLFIAPC